MTSAVVQVDHLSFSYENTERRQLREVSFAIPRGQRVVVMGATGAGKTTLSMTLNGLVPQLHHGALQGRVRVLGRDPAQGGRGQVVRAVGLVMQDPETQVLGHTVLEDAAMGPANLGLPRDEVLDRAHRALHVVGLADLADRDTDQLSGGQLQRLAIAGVLAMDPPILVLDEPTSELDPVGTAKVFELVRRLTDDEAHTVVLIDHEAELIAEWAQRLIVLADGAVAFDGLPATLFRDAELAARLRVRSPQVSQVGVALAAADRLMDGTIPTTVDEAVVAFRPLRNGAGIGVESRQRPAGVGQASAAERDARQPVVEVHDLTFQYPSGVTALRDVTCTIEAGEFVAIVGRNGAGKTTFARHLNGLLRCTSGEVRINGAPTEGRSITDLAAHVGYVFQNPDHQIFASTIYDEIAYGLRNAGWEEDQIRHRVDEVLELVDLDLVLDTPPFRLGKGERQRLAVATVLALSPAVLVVDEPTTGQDWAGAQAMLDLMAEFNTAGHTILMITHDMRLVAQYARRVLVFDRARLVGDAPPAEVFADTELTDSIELIAPQVTDLGRRLGFDHTIVTVTDCVAALEEGRVRPLRPR